jgi:hypothetical protein
VAAAAVHSRSWRLGVVPATSHVHVRSSPFSFASASDGTCTHIAVTSRVTTTPAAVGLTWLSYLSRNAARSHQLVHTPPPHHAYTFTDRARAWLVTSASHLHHQHAIRLTKSALLRAYCGACARQYAHLLHSLSEHGAPASAIAVQMWWPRTGVYLYPLHRHLLAHAHPLVLCLGGLRRYQACCSSL